MMTSKMKKTSKTKTTCNMVKCNIEGCIIYYLKKLLTTPDHSKTDPTSDILSAI